MANKSSEFIDLEGLLKQYKSKWYLFAISILICGGIAFAYAQLRQREYAVKANILINPEKDTPQSGLGSLGALFGSDGYVDDEIFIVSSHSLYREVARDLGINIGYVVVKDLIVDQIAYPEHPVEVIPQAGMLDTLQRGINFKLSVDKNGKTDIKAKMRRSTVASAEGVTLPYTLETPIGKFTFAKTATYPTGESLTTKIAVDGYDGAAEALALQVSTEIASKRSNVISLSINTTNTKYGEAILDEIIKKYNQRGINEKKEKNELTANFIDSRLDILAGELGVAENNILNFKQKNGIIDLATEAKYNTEKRGLVEQQLIEARTQEEIMRITRDFIHEPRNAYAMIPTTVENEGLQHAIEQYNGSVMGLLDMSRSANADNEALKLMREKIDMMRANIGTSLDRALKTANVAVTDLNNVLNEAESTLSGIPEIERQFRDLMRQQQVKQSLFMFLLQRREESSMLLANSSPKGTVIDAAYTVGEPLGMSKKMILLIGLFMGLMIPPVYLYMRRLLHNRFETRADVERITDIPILGEMCIDDSGRSIVVSSDDTSATAELFRLMRSNLLFILNDPRDKVVLMTSSTSGEGKSFISINLAASLALLGKRVLLVGMDIRNPQLANYLGISPRYGLTQYLSSSEISIDQIITTLDNPKDLDVIVAGPVPPNPAELLINEKVDALFAELRTRYDYIIIDTAPIGLVSDTFTLDRLADAAIYVCRANYTSLSDLEKVNDIYEQHRLKKLSLAINGTASKKTYGYGRKKKG